MQTDHIEVVWSKKWVKAHLPATWRLLKNSEKFTKHSHIHAAINRRAALLSTISRVTENGLVALIRSGMDCDCTQYYSVCHIKPMTSVVKFLKDEEEHRAWLDGPESVYFGKPSEYPETNLYSDRALAAYEDGHISHVTWADISEMHE